MIQTAEFISETYGTPREGPYYQTDIARAFFQLPFFCHESNIYEDEIYYIEIEMFYNKLWDIDDLCNTDEFRVMFLYCKKTAKYEYQPLVQAPLDQENKPPFKLLERIQVEIFKPPCDWPMPS